MEKFKISHKKYLENYLYTIKSTLEELEIKNRIATAEFNVAYNILKSKIESIEEQLKNGVDSND